MLSVAKVACPLLLSKLGELPLEGFLSFCCVEPSPVPIFSCKLSLTKDSVSLDHQFVAKKPAGPDLTKLRVRVTSYLLEDGDTDMTNANQAIQVTSS